MDEPGATSVKRRAHGKVALIAHLLRFPEDLRDIRRLVAESGLSVRDVGEALDALGRIRGADEPI
ncbi:MAG TPA: hypothetical protein VKG23_13070 [Thermoanaerobaculia bacterium]|nr:hypothetical protein [Thermoanaerobaculia bacterium]